MTKTNNKLNPHMQHWWEASALTTEPQKIVHKLKMLWSVPVVNYGVLSLTFTCSLMA